MELLLLLPLVTGKTNVSNPILSRINSTLNFSLKVPLIDLIRGARSCAYNLVSREVQKVNFLASPWEGMDSGGSFCKCKKGAQKFLVVTKNKVVSLYMFSPKMMGIYMGKKSFI